MTSTTLITAVINNGQFSANGNFSGYTATGVRVHIYQRQMSAIGWEADDDVKYPFYALAKEKEITPFEADGKTLSETKSIRLTATAVFTTVDALAAAKGEVVLVEAKVNSIIAKQAVAAGLSEDTMKDLLSVAV
jgi:hypothetical protein